MAAIKCYWIRQRAERQSKDCQDAIIVSEEWYSTDGLTWALDGVYYEWYTSGTADYLMRTPDAEALARDMGQKRYSPIMRAVPTWSYDGWGVDGAGICCNNWSSKDNWGKKQRHMEKIIKAVRAGRWNAADLPDHA